MDDWHAEGIRDNGDLNDDDDDDDEAEEEEEEQGLSEHGLSVEEW